MMPAELMEDGILIHQGIFDRKLTDGCGRGGLFNLDDGLSTSPAGRVSKSAAERAPASQNQKPSDKLWMARASMLW
jgi:hypothetical protein